MPWRSQGIHLNLALKWDNFGGSSLTPKGSHPEMTTLTDTQIRNAKPAAWAVRLHDDRGLYLEVSPKGGK